MSAADDLAQIEESTDWASLIERALADEPDPGELAFQYHRWATMFSIAYGGQPMPSDILPPGMSDFFRLLAFADIPLELIQWADSFERDHSRRPKKEDIPRGLIRLLPKPGRKGRPRCDTQKMRKAARAWEAEVMRQSYEARRDGIAIGRLAGFTKCFGFDQANLQSDRPSALALAKLAEETGKSENYLLDILFPERRNRKT